MKYIVYLHGFNSSPQSEKAQLTESYFHTHCSQSIKIITPALPPAPLKAIDTVHDLIKQNGRDNLLGFVGSSLGGFYSLYLQYFYRSDSNTPKAVLINPAVRPYDLLLDYLGENQNMYTGETYTIKHEHMDELKSLSVPSLAKHSLTLLLTQTGDEVLPYQEALNYLRQASIWVQYGGSHAFDDYLSVLPSVKNFFSKT